MDPKPGAADQTRRTATPVTQKTPTQNKMIYNLISQTVPTGAHYGVCADVIVGEVSIKKKVYFVLTLLLQLEAARRNGVRWEITKKYVLNGRGRSQLIADLCSLTGRVWTLADLEQFDPEATFLNKTVQVIVHQRISNGQSEAVAGTLLSAGNMEVKVSDDFVREKDKSAQSAGAQAAVVSAW
jgi:hypothetical protein